MVNFSEAFTLLQSARNAVRDMQSAPVSQLLLDLQGQLLQLQIDTLEQQLEDQTLRDTLVRLRQNLAVQRKLQRVNETYLLVKGKDDVRGPYCVTCWDVRDVLQLLVDPREGSGYCPVCRAFGRTDEISTSGPAA